MWYPEAVFLKLIFGRLLNSTSSQGTQERGITFVVYLYPFPCLWILVDAQTHKERLRGGCHSLYKCLRAANRSQEDGHKEDDGHHKDSRLGSCQAHRIGSMWTYVHMRSCSTELDYPCKEVGISRNWILG